MSWRNRSLVKKLYGNEWFREVGDEDGTLLIVGHDPTSL